MARKLYGRVSGEEIPATETTPKLPKEDAAPQDLRPAVAITDTPTVGEVGESHGEILEQAGVPPKEIPHEDPRRGFVDVNNPEVLLDRDKAEQIAGVEGTAKAGGLDSQDLKKIPETPATFVPDKPIEQPAPIPSDASPTQSAPTTEAGKTVVPEETKSKRVAYSSGSTNRFHKETELNGPDILSWIQENMKMMSARAARLKWGREKFRKNKSLYDDSPTLQKPHHNIIYSPSGEAPDQVAQAAFEAGQLKEPSVNALWKAIDSASKKRKNVFETSRRESAFIKEEAKQYSDWLKATTKGEIHVTAEDLKVGDFLQVEGQNVEVTAVDADGNVTLKDGKKFGVQVIGEGQKIFVERFDPIPESDVEFGEEQKTPDVPKLGTMEKGTGDLLKTVDEPFALTGEKGSDSERLASEKAKAAQTSAEAKAITDKQQGMLGMGGAVPAEFVPSGGTPTSIKNATVDAERGGSPHPSLLFRRGLTPSRSALPRAP